MLMKPLYMDWNLSSERTFLSFHRSWKIQFRHQPQPDPKSRGPGQPGTCGQSKSESFLQRIPSIPGPVAISGQRKLELFPSGSLAWMCVASFNVFGPRLTEVSQAGTPDIYGTARPSSGSVHQERLCRELLCELGKKPAEQQAFKTIEYKDVEYTAQVLPQLEEPIRSRCLANIQ